MGDLDQVPKATCTCHFSSFCMYGYFEHLIKLSMDCSHSPLVCMMYVPKEHQMYSEPVRAKQASPQAQYTIAELSIMADVNFL